MRERCTLRETTFIPTSSIDSGYLGSGIGALEECLRSCLKERQPLINFLIG